MQTERISGVAYSNLACRTRTASHKPVEEYADARMVLRSRKYRTDADAVTAALSAATPPSLLRFAAVYAAGDATPTPLGRPSRFASLSPTEGRAERSD